MFSQFRQYLKERIEDCTDRIEWEDAINVDNVPGSNVDTRYHILTGSIGGDLRNDMYMEDIFPVTVTIWLRGFRNPISARDNLLDEAKQIRDSAVSPNNLELFNRDQLSNTILSIPESTIEATAIDGSNDDTIKCEIVLNARLFSNI